MNSVPKMLKRPNCIENQVNISCQNQIHKICFSKSIFEIAVLALYYISSTSSKWVFFKKNTTEKSNAMQHFRSKSSAMLLKTTIQFESGENTIQKHFFEESGKKFQLTIALQKKHISTKLKDKLPEDVDIYENDTLTLS